MGIVQKLEWKYYSNSYLNVKQLSQKSNFWLLDNDNHFSDKCCDNTGSILLHIWLELLLSGCLAHFTFPVFIMNTFSWAAEYCGSVIRLFRFLLSEPVGCQLNEGTCGAGKQSIHTHIISLLGSDIWNALIYFPTAHIDYHKYKFQYPLLNLCET